jgi:hypothetical protein
VGEVIANFPRDQLYGARVGVAVAHVAHHVDIALATHGRTDIELTLGIGGQFHSGVIHIASGRAIGTGIDQNAPQGAIAPHANVNPALGLLHTGGQQ